MGEGAVAPHLWTCFCCRAAYNILPQPRVPTSVQGSGGRPRRQREPTSQEAAVTLHGIVDKSEARFGLLRVSLPGGHILVPSTSGVVGDQIPRSHSRERRQLDARVTRSKFDSQRTAGSNRRNKCARRVRSPSSHGLG
jgi:hypothetical protein